MNLVQILKTHTLIVHAEGVNDNCVEIKVKVTKKMLSYLDMES